jgi:hypothetical protein
MFIEIVRSCVMYTKEIISYLLWPALIFITWVLVKYVLRIYEKTERSRQNDTL